LRVTWAGREKLLFLLFLVLRLSIGVTPVCGRIPGPQHSIFVCYIGDRCGISKRCGGDFHTVKIETATLGERDSFLKGVLRHGVTMAFLCMYTLFYTQG